MNTLSRDLHTTYLTSAIRQLQDPSWRLDGRGKEHRGALAALLQLSLLNSREKFMLASREIQVQEEDRQATAKLASSLEITLVGYQESIQEELSYAPSPLSLGQKTARGLCQILRTPGREQDYGQVLAWALVIDLYLSMALYDFPKPLLRRLAQAVGQAYGTPDFDCKQYESLYAYMSQEVDCQRTLPMVLLEDVGRIKWDDDIKKEDLFEALDFLRESLGY